MNITEIEAKSILRKHKKIDSWFIARYGMNLYRGCSHNCVYCDGRAEGYYVEGEFGEDVAVKINAIELLQKELDPKKKRKPLKSSFIMIGGGVGDSYQPIEKKYQLCRKILQLLYEFRLPAHILTKSTLVQRDLELIKKINRQSRSIVSFSFSSVDDEISAKFEPGVPSPSQRLKTLALFKKEGIACGMFLLPVIPFITDGPKLMEQAIVKASELDLDFIIFGGMTLKQGRQKDYFMNTLCEHYPEAAPKYNHIYRGDKWGGATERYYQQLNNIFYEIAKSVKIPKRIPLPLFKDMLDENDLVIVLLEHIDYYLRLRGEKSPYGFAAYSLSQIKEPLSQLSRAELLKIKGVGQATAQVIREILNTGSSSLYRRLIN